ncbi:MAG: hypothetical protein KAS71_11190 [Bacteroidales bacterium]|nr:hypothetical protein [Bacteroidales bacterium]
MLNLKELETRLDKALENETTDSLTSWLFNQRKDNLESFFGTGSIETFKDIPYSYRQNPSYKNNYKNKCEAEPNTKLANAA